MDIATIPQSGKLWKTTPFTGELVLVKQTTKPQGKLSSFVSLMFRVDILSINVL
jgi:hypothetical protein